MAGRLSLMFTSMILTAAVLIWALDSVADDARILPKGVTRARLNVLFYLPTDQKFNNDNDAEDLGYDYSTTINSTIFPELALLEAGFGMPSGTASLGRSAVSIEYQPTVYDFYLEHGLTDHLSVGIKIPYWFMDADVSARMTTGSATIGFNPYFGQTGDPFGTSLIPVAYGGVLDDDLATSLVQEFLVQTYGYTPLSSWSGRGIGDIELGGRYQYFKSDQWRLAVLGGVRLPTGETDDPDNLIDNTAGSGAFGIFLYLNNDYTGIENLLLNLTLKIDILLPDSETLRVPDNISQPITANRETVDRDQGDVFEISTSALYQINDAFGVFGEYQHIYTLEDSISGDLGYAYDQLESESEVRSHVARIGMIYSTLPLYEKKKFPLPMQFHIVYRDRFAGRNILKSRYVELGAGIYF